MTHFLFRRILQAVTLASGPASLSAASPGRTVTLGTEGAYAPFTFVDEKGDLLGEGRSDDVFDRPRHERTVRFLQQVTQT